MIKLSIIIPIYNGEKFIDKCMQSLLAETDNEVEIILINDGSKDATGDICKKYEKYDGVKIITNTNHGVSYSRNCGLSKATGEYIMFLDIDDYLLTGWKETIFESLDDNNDVVYFSSSYNSKYSKDEVIYSIFGINKDLKWLSTPWSKIFKRKFLLDNNMSFIPGIINGEDMLFNLSVILSTNKYCFIDKSIYSYRIINTSVTKSFNEKIFKSDIEFQKHLNNILSNYETYNKTISSYCVKNAITLFIRKISMVSLDEGKKYYYIFKENPYYDYIMSNDIKDENIRTKFFMFLLKNKLYKTSVIAMKIFRIIKRKNKINEYFINV